MEDEVLFLMEMFNGLDPMMIRKWPSSFRRRIVYKKIELEKKRDEARKSASRSPRRPMR